MLFRGWCASREEQQMTSPHPITRQAKQLGAGVFQPEISVPDDHSRTDLDLDGRQIRIRGKGGKGRIVKIGHEAARALDRYLRVRGRHAEAYRPQLWLGVSNKGPLTPAGIYQAVARRGQQCGVAVYPHRFRHHFSQTWLDRGGAEGDLMELNGWSSPQMLTRYGASTRAARARRNYDRIMEDALRT